MGELTPVIPALFRCPSCNATGIRHEYHDYADEPLGCPDCQGQGIYNVEYAFKIGRLIDRATINYEAAVRTWEEYEQDADPYENRTYEQMIRDAVDAAVKEGDDE